MRPIDGPVWPSRVASLERRVMADEFGKAVIIEVVDIEATVHFPALASPLAVRFNRLLERSRVHAADARRGR
jgi:hypothetical protein